MKRQWQGIILLTVMVVFGLALFAGCASMTGETAGEKVDDATITTQANAIIIKDPSASYLKIDVDTRQGEVTLSGYVPDKATEDRLVDKIQQVRGVKSVKSMLKIQEKKGM